MYNLRKGEGQRVHEHGFPHDAYVVRGVVDFLLGSITKTLSAPAEVHFPTGAEHGFVAVSDEATVIAVRDTKGAA